MKNLLIYAAQADRLAGWWTLAITLCFAIGFAVGAMAGSDLPK